MIINQLVRAAGVDWAGNQPVNWIETQTQDVYLYAGEEDITQRPELVGATLIGSWDIDGNVLFVDVAEYEAIRPLGNNLDGSATGILAYHSVMGHALRALQPTGELYPPDIEPFDVEIRYKQFTGEVNPTWNGWGWRAELHGEASTRDPSARAVGIYSDAACTAYLYTTGAFTQQQSEWQTDEQGQPLTVWATQYNPAYQGADNDEQMDIHFALLYGSAQEGFASLLPGSDGVRLLFWDRIQGQEPDPGETWTDTGVVTVAPVGALYQLSETVVMTAGETIRLGDFETTFTGYWNGLPAPNAYIAIDPSPPALLPNGTHLWRLL